MTVTGPLQKSEISGRKTSLATSLVDRFETRSGCPAVSKPLMSSDSGSGSKLYAAAVGISSPPNSNDLWEAREGPMPLKAAEEVSMKADRETWQ